MSLVLPRPHRRGMSGRARRRWFFTLYVAGCASVATATGYVGYSPFAPPHVPQAIQAVLGLLMVFVVPGLALVCAALPELESWIDRLLASVGISLTAATCDAVLLAGTPVGFSRQPLAELLGGVAVVLSVGGLYSSRLAVAVWTLRACMQRAWTEKVSVEKLRGAQRIDNFAKSARSQQDTEIHGRRSVVVLKFSFDGKPVDPGA